MRKMKVLALLLPLLQLCSSYDAGEAVTKRTEKYREMCKKYNDPRR